MSEEPKVPPAQSEQRDGTNNLWAVVLAGGEGSRLTPITRLLYGSDIPKQFALLDGDRSLLQRTMDRIGRLVPPRRTVVVVARNRRAMAETQLGRYQGVQIVCQPTNVGTGPGVLLPLSLIKAQSPSASVLITPADHHIPRPIPFFNAVRLAAVTASATPSGLVVLGAEAERPDADLGWILPRGPAPTSDAELGPFEDESSVTGESGVAGEVGDVGSRRKIELVGVFVEKPAISTARELFRRGGLWNTMVVLGRVRSFWRQAEQQLPYQVALFNRYVDALANVGGRPDALADRLLGQIYRSMPRADFSRSILQNSRGTGVVKLAGSGWCDCGTPERLLGCLGEAVGQGRKEAIRAALQSMLPVAN